MEFVFGFLGFFAGIAGTVFCWWFTDLIQRRRSPLNHFDAALMEELKNLGSAINITKDEFRDLRSGIVNRLRCHARYLQRKRERAYHYVSPNWERLPTIQFEAGKYKPALHLTDALNDLLDTLREQP
jgi:hypothetical protein